MRRQNRQPDRRRTEPKLATLATSSEPPTTRESAEKSRPLARGVHGLHPKSVRVRAQRRTDQIDLPTARDARHALMHAIHVGRPINRHLTVCWQLGGVSDAVQATGRLMKLVCDGARRRGQRVSYLWVRESGGTVGDHVHILFHLPEALTGWYRSRKAGWLKRCGTTFDEGTSKTTRVRGATPVVTGVATRSKLYEENLRALESYVLKHCSREVSKALGINRKGPSTVTGKRVSISQDLHRKARAFCGDCRA